VIQRLTILVIASVLLCSQAFAQSTQTRLSSLKKNIHSVKKQITHDAKKRKHFNAALAKTESHISSLSQQLTLTNADLSSKNKSLKKYQKKSHVLLANINKQQVVLAKQIRSSYMLGQQPYLKLLLNQQNPEKIERMLAYYHYFNKQRLQSIATLQSSLKILSTTLAQINTKKLQLLALISQQKEEQALLGSVQKKRTQLVKDLSLRITSQKTKLAILLKNKKQLERIIAKAGQQKLNARIRTQRFDRLKGKLPWPTKGKLIQQFGTQIGKSELRYEGVLIKAPQGQTVRAIAAGKVVFARWLSGYGLLIIVNHGNGYMTLYGRNHATLKHVGDLVKKGENIATVGDSGGYNQSSLYFAIRHNAKPLNPNRWCH
jgi:murein hydrolase activator